MLSCFLQNREWSLVSVLILLGVAMFSKGEYAFLHDKLSEQTRLPSLCHLRCAKESNEAISVEECVQSCQREFTLLLEPGYNIRKRVIKKPLIRHKRSVGDMHVINECQPSSQAPALHHVKNLAVNFTAKGPIHVTWEAMDPAKTDYNWTGYALIYHGEPEGEEKTNAPSCRVVPKNRTDYLLMQVNDWKYPQTFHIAVITYPYNREGEIKLRGFTPKVSRPPISIPTASNKETAKFVSSIVGGLIAGVTLLLILYAAVKWKRNRLCPVDDQRMPPPVPARPHNTKATKERYYCCYYPESEEFRERVASIVNYFRENGYNVIMDRMVSEEITSQGPTRWGENQIRKAKKVLIFLSPGLVNLALDGREDSQCQDINRVWIELEVLRDLYTRNRSAAKMVCITLPDVPVTSEVLPLWAKVSYKWPEDALEILKRLNDRPMILPV
ncbi:uncharacterized protein LOC144633275 isoform X2 [Oculina patagonica]